MADSNKTRAANKRARDKAWMKERGATAVPLIFFRGTTLVADKLCRHYGFTDKDKYEELITTLIHEAAGKL